MRIAEGGCLGDFGALFTVRVRLAVGLRPRWEVDGRTSSTGSIVNLSLHNRCILFPALLTLLLFLSMYPSPFLLSVVNQSIYSSVHHYLIHQLSEYLSTINYSLLCIHPSLSLTVTFNFISRMCVKYKMYLQITLCHVGSF